ncbi:MAG: PmoA family protein [Acidobacteria bacterium]|nr:PmoA family protein [Acidobacteriota bacterium]
MKRRNFLLASAAPLLHAAGDDFAVRWETGRVDVLWSKTGELFTSFHCGDKWNKPFLYPLKSPSGVVMSRGWPVDPRPGETNDHVWQRGIYWGHGDINKHDFWREQGRDKTSILALDGPPKVSTARSAASISARFHLRSPNADLGSVQQNYTLAYIAERVWIMATITVNAGKGIPLTFGDSDDGGFAVRLSDDFRQDRGAVLVNSDGLQKTENIWGKPAKWVDYSTNVNGKPCGVTVMDHPSNFRHPVEWHARGYGLFSANPFASRSFAKGKDPTKDGTYTLPAGKQLRFLYRVILHDGIADPVATHRLYARFAAAGPQDAKI